MDHTSLRPRARLVARVMSALLFLLFLGGCFVSSQPLITEASADFPVTEETQLLELDPKTFDQKTGRDGQPTTLLISIENGFYILREGEEEKHRFLLKEIDDDYYVIMVSPKPGGSGRVEYPYGMLEVDEKSNRVVVYHSPAKFTDYVNYLNKVNPAKVSELSRHWRKKGDLALEVDSLESLMLVLIDMRNMGYLGEPSQAFSIAAAQNEANSEVGALSFSAQSPVQELISRNVGEGIVVLRDSDGVSIEMSSERISTGYTVTQDGKLCTYKSSFRGYSVVLIDDDCDFSVNRANVNGASDSDPNRFDSIYRDVVTGPVLRLMASVTGNESHQKQYVISALSPLLGTSRGELFREDRNFFTDIADGGKEVAATLERTSGPNHLVDAEWLNLRFGLSSRLIEFGSISNRESQSCFFSSTTSGIDMQVWPAWTYVREFKDWSPVSERANLIMYFDYKCDGLLDAALIGKDKVMKEDLEVAQPVFDASINNDYLIPVVLLMQSYIPVGDSMEHGITARLTFREDPTESDKVVAQFSDRATRMCIDLGNLNQGISDNKTIAEFFDALEANKPMDAFGKQSEAERSDDPAIVAFANICGAMLISHQAVDEIVGISAALAYYDLALKYDLLPQRLVEGIDRQKELAARLGL